jgi:hypothetical protein
MTLNYTESVLFKVGLGITTFYFMATYLAISVFYFNLRHINHNENISSKNIEGSKYLKSSIIHKKEKLY